MRTEHTSNKQHLRLLMYGLQQKCQQIPPNLVVAVSLLSRPLPRLHPPQPRRQSPRHRPGPDCNDYRMPTDRLAGI